MKNEKIHEREIWAAMLKDPIAYARSLRYVVVSLGCFAAIVLIHIACTR